MADENDKTEEAIRKIISEHCCSGCDATVCDTYMNTGHVGDTTEQTTKRIMDYLIGCGIRT